jgi:hypothetical protein
LYRYFRGEGIATGVGDWLPSEELSIGGPCINSTFLLVSRYVERHIAHAPYYWIRIAVPTNLIVSKEWISVSADAGLPSSAASEAANGGYERREPVNLVIQVTDTMRFSPSRTSIQRCVELLPSQQAEWEVQMV